MKLEETKNSKKFENDSSKANFIGITFLKAAISKLLFYYDFFEFLKLHCKYIKIFCQKVCRNYIFECNF